ncbi:hypothetical protein MNEG_12820, partial [Monoraphidium neglectum]
RPPLRRRRGQAAGGPLGLHGCARPQGPTEPGLRHRGRGAAAGGGARGGHRGVQAAEARAVSEEAAGGVEEGDGNEEGV